MDDCTIADRVGKEREPKTERKMQQLRVTGNPKTERIRVFYGG